MKFTFIDLFAGIGGFHIGLTSAGGKCIYANEWDKFSRLTYETWFSGIEVDGRDIRTVDILNDIPKHDVLAGGFPCQPFSLAGVSKKNSLGRKHGFQDELQGNLFLHVCEILRVKQPKVVFLENVKHLISHDKGNTWKTIKRELEELGYSLYWSIIDASSWVPQHRKRIYIVGFQEKNFTPDEISKFRFPTPSLRQPELRSILEREPSKKYMLSDNLWRYLRDYAIKHNSLGNGFGFSIANPNGPSRTLSARYGKDGSEILIEQSGWRNPRRLTPREAAKLMGFDTSWKEKLGIQFYQTVSDTQAYKQFGNSVCPQVVEAIGLEIGHVLAARNQRLGKK
jgi:DNA (cytosine-5)-methyltransferase 1